MLVMDPVLEFPEHHLMEAALIVVVVHRWPRRISSRVASAIEVERS
jgi:hypothetical protein